MYGSVVGSQLVTIKNTWHRQSVTATLYGISVVIIYIVRSALNRNT